MGVYTDNIAYKEVSLVSERSPAGSRVYAQHAGGQDENPLLAIRMSGDVLHVTVNEIMEWADHLSDEFANQEDD